MPWVYIMSNHARTTLYISVTANLRARVERHKSLAAPGFTSKYKLTDLVYAEEAKSIVDAIQREKQLKKWGRAKKDRLIRSLNPELVDLSYSL